MPSSPTFSPKDSLISAISLFVFTFLDLLDLLLCYFYRFLDGILEDNPIPCYCHNRAKQEASDGEDIVSETLCRRRNLFREMGLPFLKAKLDGKQYEGEPCSPRWSDCSCNSCLSWQEKGDEKLHVVAMEPSQGKKGEHGMNSIENAFFIHGFLSSSSVWVETVFPNLSDVTRQNMRMIAVDLLGFGRSPKPTNCKYRLKDHLEMIEKSAIVPFQLSSYHIVAHSMGCIIALAMAAKYPEAVKSITLVAPPYFDSTEEEASQTALNKLAERRVWPPLLFGSAVMSWYEHVGRTVCFMFCRNHLIWEWIMKLVTRRRDLSFLFIDLTKHTHYSAWHTMHNVICGGAKSMDKYLEVVRKAKIPVKIIQGDKDQVVPLECSFNLKAKLDPAELKIVNGRDHSSVIVGREEAFTRELEDTWFSSKNCTKMSNG
ncbi:putative lysophospholipase BODYGUARD 4 isoform X1 [Canna indica]|uniref:Lysophospholipase BODYGUARD 4 isoform X1 n=1 Tax=Canna indica TaxID=4628 RepID=A0AAQ3KE03_9LILI|nr:putative lysophospholipase BODYGUARD 4 isoform X1 [Canna indica]